MLEQLKKIYSHLIKLPFVGSFVRFPVRILKFVIVRVDTKRQVLLEDALAGLRGDVDSYQQGEVALHSSKKKCDS